MGTLGAWLAVADPWRKPETREEALRAGRLGAVALLVQAAQGFAAVVAFVSRKDVVAAAFNQQLAAQYAEMGMDAETSARMTATFGSMFVDTMTWGMAIFSVIYVVLAIVQWRSPNRVIPAIFLALLGIALLSALARLVNPHAMAPPYPLWFMFGSWLITALTALFYLASWRGAGRLAELRTAEAA